MDRVLTPELRELYELSTPNGLRAVRILPGTNGKMAVIGRGQGDVVEPFAQLLREERYTVETIKNVPGNRKLWREFEAFVEERRSILGESYKLTTEEIMGTRFYQLDEAWTVGILEQGHTIIDMGNPLKRSQSIFLDMEYQHIFGR